MLLDPPNNSPCAGRESSILKNEDTIDTKSKPDIMNIQEAAEYLRKSTSWVYKNWKALGGRKLGGSLFFPSKEDLYESIFQKRKGVAVRLHPEGDQVHRNLVQDKKRSKKGGSRKTKGGIKPGTTITNPDRHGLLGTGKQEA